MLIFFCKSEMTKTNQFPKDLKTMAENYEIKTGDKVQVIVQVWREDEQPTYRNFYEGKI